MRAEPANVFDFDNSYARLPERFFSALAPTPVAEPRLVKLNEKLARDLGLEPSTLSSPEGVAVLAGNNVAAGSKPLAMAYAGHQFGHFAPQLGDGRAILLGEIIDREGVRRDVQLKGSGPTPFSRMGDGRAGLGPVLREYIVSEAMAALGIPTTRALAAVATGETVQRETASPGAVLTRIASSHIRVGTFQFFAAQKDTDAIRDLADHVIARHYPDAKDAENPYRALLDAVIERQAALIANWLHIGFIHGVMNTDNMLLSGETIDYGPCAFVDSYHPETVYSSIDKEGRYGFANQPRMAQWNLARLAEALLPLLADDQEAGLAQAQEAINGFASAFENHYVSGLIRKIGLRHRQDDDLALAQDLLEAMAANEADFTLTFRHLSDAATDSVFDAELRSLFSDPKAFDDWAVKWRKRLEEEPGTPEERQTDMRSVNPMFIPRNHLVEEALKAAEHDEDYAPFEKLLLVLSKPFDDQAGLERYTQPPLPDQIVHQTFCGT